MKHQATMIVALSLALGLAALVAANADDLKVSQLEQDVRELKQQLTQHARRIEVLESERTRAQPTIAPPPDRPAAKSADPQSAWLSIANWDGVRVGMSEQEVVRQLGAPTATRKAEQGNGQLLLYAMEIGTGRFLAGRVEMSDARVIAIHKPALR